MWYVFLIISDTLILKVLALSLERFISIVFPIHFRKWNSPQRAWRAIIVAYSLPALFYIPYALWRYEVVDDQFAPDGSIIYRAVDSNRYYGSLQWQLYEWIRETLLRFLPIIILCILNVQIIIAFRKRQNMLARLTNRTPSGRGQSSIVVVSGNDRRDDTLLFILAGIVIMFFICNIPAAINLLFINEMVKKRSDYQIFRAVANLLEITNHAAQFYVFCACSSDYRSTFLEKFPCVKSAYRKADSIRTFSRSMMQQKKMMSINHNDNIEQYHHHRTMHREHDDDETTVDVHLASAEDDVLSGESSSGGGAEYRSLLKYGEQTKQQCHQSVLVVDDSGTTYL